MERMTGFKILAFRRGSLAACQGECPDDEDAYFDLPPISWVLPHHVDIRAR